MHVNMKDRLTCISPSIDADVEAGDTKISQLDDLSLLQQQALNCIELRLIEIEVVCDMPLWE
jgi:hypothetical protein